MQGENPPPPSPSPTVHVEAPSDGAVVMNEPVIPEDVDDVTLMQAVSSYANKHGVPSTRLKIEAFGASTAMQIDKARRAEFVRSLA